MCKSYNGKPTQRLRKDKIGSREVLYQDLYLRVDSLDKEKNTVEFHCCITGCSKPLCQIHTNKYGGIVFQNFFNHLKVNHEEFLFECDRPNLVPVLEPSASKSLMTGHFETTPTVETTSSSVETRPTAPQSIVRAMKVQDEKLKEKILQAIVKVIAHGPFPISMLDNPAISEFLKELGIISENFKLPSRRTVTRRLDEFLVAEEKEQTDKVISSLEFYGVAWDEWTSKQNLNYMALTVTGIPADFSCLTDFLVSCSLFTYPHAMKDIRLKVIQCVQRMLPSVHLEPTCEEGLVLESFLKKVFSLTYDGAASNYAFSPNPQAAGIIATEKTERRVVCEKYKTIEERRCICHRVVKILEHCYNDSGNDASEFFKEMIDSIYIFFDLIKSSQKNEQELRRMQEVDLLRVGKIVVDISVPATRWNYNARRLPRIYRLWPYASTMESQTAETANEKREWSVKKHNCQEGLDILKPVIPIITRVQTWITYLQNTRSPTVSLLLYIMEDLIAVCDDLANEADNNGHHQAEIILSRMLAEFRAEFQEDLADDYLKLAQLFDPRVCHRTLSVAEVDRLLSLAVTTYIPVSEIAVGQYEEDIFSSPLSHNDYSSEITAFKDQMKNKVKKKVTSSDGTSKWEYFGGADRQQDIDVFEFYQDFIKQIPNLSKAIRKVLADPSATATNERVFNVAGNILNIRRCRLDPSRAENLILSAFRYKVGLSKATKPPKLPSFRVINDSQDEFDDGETELVQRMEEEAAAWEDFFTQ